MYRKMKGRKNRFQVFEKLKFRSKWTPLWTSPTPIFLQHVRSYMKQKFHSLTRQHRRFWVSWLTYNKLMEIVGIRRTFSRKRWVEIPTDPMRIIISVSPFGSSTPQCLKNVIVVSYRMHNVFCSHSIHTRSISPICISTNHFFQKISNA